MRQLQLKDKFKKKHFGGQNKRPSKYINQKQIAKSITELKYMS